METGERIYYRTLLGVKCSSKRIAYNFLEGRIGKDELFEYNGRTLDFTQISQEDEIVKSIIGDIKLVVIPSIEELQKQLKEIQTENEILYNVCEQFCTNAKDAAALLETISNRTNLNQEFNTVIFGLKKSFFNLANIVCNENKEKFSLYTEAITKIQLYDNYCQQVEHGLKQKEEDLLKKEKDANERIAREKQEALDFIAFSKTKQNEYNQSLLKNIEEVKNKTKNDIQVTKDQFLSWVQEKERLIESIKKDAIEEISKHIEIENELLTKLNINRSKIESIFTDILSSKIDDISSNHKIKRCYFKNNKHSLFIPERKLYNAIRSFAPSIAPEDVLALYDDTLLMTGKRGILLTYKSVIIFDGTLDDTQLPIAKKIISLPLIPESRVYIYNKWFKTILQDNKKEQNATFSFLYRKDLAFLCNVINELCERAFNESLTINKINEIILYLESQVINDNINNIIDNFYNSLP